MNKLEGGTRIVKIPFKKLEVKEIIVGIVKDMFEQEEKVYNDMHFDAQLGYQLELTNDDGSTQMVNFCIRKSQFNIRAMRGLQVGHKIGFERKDDLPPPKKGLKPIHVIDIIRFP
jgi:hypothetical protein